MSFSIITFVTIMYRNDVLSWLFTSRLTRHFFVRHTLSEMENFKFQVYVAY